MPLPAPHQIIARAPVLPVAAVPSAAAGVRLARALLEGGLPILEVTLRTPAALDAISAIAREMPEIAVGAGTVTSPDLIGPAIDAGAQFLASPGTPPRLAEALARAPIPVLPGCATATEAMILHDLGFSVLNLSPIEPLGGCALIRSLAGPLPSLRFCPSGGITSENAPKYLSQPAVLAVAGSWVAPSEAIALGDWEQIVALSKAASQLHRAAILN